jgi:predicted metalloendopeptidase
MMPGFFQGAEKILTNADPEELRAYLKWNLVTDAAPLLSSPFVEENFEFFGKRLSGQQVDEERWKKCSSWTTGAMSEQLGRIFVDRYFAGDSKEKALEMVRGIQAAFDGNLPALEWMDDITRAKAVEKSAAMRFKIGYPDTWRDYSSMKITSGGFFDNIMEAGRFEIDRNMKKINQPVDKSEWYMAPSAVNAGYVSRANELMFPAGILQPPFFHRDHPPAMNFGGIGMVIGHELTHGFDDSGRKYDKNGRLQEWWEPQVSEAFEERAECIVEHASGHEVIPGVHLNGRLTLGENIADLGGLKQAYLGYKASDDPEGQFMTELSDDQLFFVAYAQLWCAHVKPEMAEQLVMADPHSDPEYRVVGPMQNYAAFAEAFSCNEGTLMNPEERCEVW